MTIYQVRYYSDYFQPQQKMLSGNIYCQFAGCCVHCVK